jgi:alanine racemase
MAVINEARPTWAEVNLKNLIFNFTSIKNFVGQDLKIMAVVKANAYGHGSVECAKVLEKLKVDCFGVALPEEGFELRDNGISSPIICLGGFWSGQENLLIDNNLTPIIYRLHMAETLNAAAEKQNKIVNYHVKIDTGMGRIGIPFDMVNEFAQKLKSFKFIKLDGLMSHFAAADDLLQNEFTKLQTKRFYAAVETFESNGFQPFYKDLANSPGAIAHAKIYGNMIRIGGIIYGLGGDILPIEVDKPVLKPVLSLHSRIALLKNVLKGETLGYSRTFKTSKDSIIATVPIGYHDGYRRSLSNRGKVIINNTYAPVVGNISMDWTIIDVTDVPKVKVNDEVIFIGRKDNLEISAEEIARLTNTISYEVTCGIGSRVRKYFKK